jgi:dihydroorotase
MAFEEAGLDLSSAEGHALFERFLCLNGPAFYGFSASAQRFQMEKATSQTPLLETPAGPITPLPLGMGLELTWRMME